MTSNLLPSEDQDGPDSLLRFRVKRLGFEEGEDANQTSGLPEVDKIKAIWLDRGFWTARRLLPCNWRLWRAYGFLNSDKKHC